jgi:hypothetical protein
MSATVEVAAWAPRRVPPPGARTPQGVPAAGLEAPSAGEIVFQFDGKGVAIDPADRRGASGLARSGLAGGRRPTSPRSATALRLAAAALTRTPARALLQATADRHDPPPRGARQRTPPARPLPLPGGGDRRQRQAVPLHAVSPRLASSSAWELADEATTDALARLSSATRLPAAWHALGVALGRPATFVSLARARRLSALAVATLADLLTSRPAAGRDAGELARERTALVRFARRLAALGLRDDPDGPFEGTAAVSPGCSTGARDRPSSSRPAAPGQSAWKTGRCAFGLRLIVPDRFPERRPSSFYNPNIHPGGDPYRGISPPAAETDRAAIGAPSPASRANPRAGALPRAASRSGSNAPPPSAPSRHPRLPLTVTPQAADVFAGGARAMDAPSPRPTAKRSGFDSASDSLGLYRQSRCGCLPLESRTA